MRTGVLAHLKGPFSIDDEHILPIEFGVFNDIGASFSGRADPYAAIGILLLVVESARCVDARADTLDYIKNFFEFSAVCRLNSESILTRCIERSMEVALCKILYRSIIMYNEIITLHDFRGFAFNIN